MWVLDSKTNVTGTIKDNREFCQMQAKGLNELNAKLLNDPKQWLKMFLSLEVQAELENH